MKCAASLLATAMLAAFLCGCNVETSGGANDKTPPIAAGTVQSLILYEKPVEAADEPGGLDIAKEYPGSVVEVYDMLIVVRTPSGERIVSPQGWFTNLRLKP
jgi:hypothetical protein